MKRILTRWDSVAISLGIVIGVGIFRVPSDVARLLPEGGLVILLAWLAGGVISLIGALCYAELATLFAETGGDYVFLREAYGRVLSFAYAWTDLTIIRTGNIAALSFLFGDYAAGLVGVDRSQSKLLAVGVVVCLALLNLLGIEWGRRAQNTFTLAKVIALLLLIACGFLYSGGRIERVTSFQSAPLDFKTVSAFGLAMIPILWTYGGWHENCFVAGETRDANRSLPFSLLTTVAVVSSIYVLANAIFLYGFSTAEIAASPLIAADMLNRQFGIYGARLLAGLVTLYSICTINAMIITGSRITYAVCSDVKALKPLSATTAKTTTPAAAVILVSVVACLFIIVGSFDRLLFFTGNVVWLFFALVVSALFIFRRRQTEREGQFRVPGYPVLPALFVVVCLALSINTWLTYPFESACGIALSAGGVLLYFIIKFLERKDAEQPTE
jgi:basic amino acid/polyamine antiporter, APA family